jgi:hypothetical protein
MPPGYLEAPGWFPRKLPADSRGSPPPPGYRLEREPRKSLWIPGLVVFGLLWGVPALTGGGVAADGNEEGALLIVPLAGPLAFTGVVGETDSAVVVSLMTVLTLGQATGVSLFIAGLATDRAVYVRNDVTVGVEAGPGGASMTVRY